MGKVVGDDRHAMRCFEVWGGNEAVTMPIEMPGLDGWLHSKPDGDSTGGGDVHYVSSCAHGALTRMLVADVSGHGQSVAEIAVQLRKLMRRYVNHHSQTAFVRAMNQAFSKLATNGRFATAIALSYDAPINRLEVCNAGHPAPIIYRQARGRWDYLDAPAKGLGRPSNEGSNYPLGIELGIEYEQFESAIEIGDVIVAYTDGLPELRIGDGKLLGRDGLLSVFESLPKVSVDQIIPELLIKLERLGAIEDDLTIFVFTPNGKRPRVPLADRLFAPVKMLNIALRG